MPTISTLGRCYVAKGQVLINTEQTDSSKRNTFFHEMVHSILDTMGRDDLSQDESFVCSFSGFLMEVHNSVPTMSNEITASSEIITD